MDQERADYDDQPGRRRRPWTLAQVAILTVAILLAIPPFAMTLVCALILLLGGMQY